MYKIKLKMCAASIVKDILYSDPSNSLIVLSKSLLYGTKNKKNEKKKQG
jgi:hypothetical protein